ncbi:hypothetical protein EV06_0379 [Prochlorococcus sp. MIT 0602]|nr:hypothetical protein EV06_0379 [Prochlorococcus sp. MIT 0602]KGG16987.1 hypothetical protein EV07_0415 [Prochlorococcus sp. MIT 0603]
MVGLGFARNIETSNGFRSKTEIGWYKARLTLHCNYFDIGNRLTA